MLVQLIHNATLLVALSALYGLISRFKKDGTLQVKLLAGLLFGLMAIAAMKMPFHYKEGVIYDGRSIVLAMAGLFGGGTTSMVSMVLAGAYRASLGGAGIWAGLATILLCPLVGLAFRRAYKNRPDHLDLLALYGVGVATHIVMLLCQLLIPAPSPWDTLARIAWPVLLVFPLATLVVGLLLSNEARRVITVKKLHESEENLRITLDSIGDAVLAVDTSGRVTRANPLAQKLIGYSKQETIGQPLENIFKIINEDTRQPVTSPVDKVLKEGRIIGLANHTLLISKDGNETPIADSAAPITNIQGQVSGVVLVFRDQTQERDAQRRLAESEKKYRSLYKSIRDAILVADIDRNIVDCNPAFTDLFGYGADELTGKKTISVYESEKEFQEMGRALKAHQGATSDFLYTVCYKKKNGDCFFGETNVFYLHDEEGRVTGFLGLIRDITARKRIEDEARRLTAILENTSDLVSTSTPDGRLTYLNQAGRQLAGWKPEEPLETHFIADLHPAWALERIETEGLPTAIQKGVWQGETALLHRKGHEIPVSQVILSHLAIDGKTEYFSTIIRDVTEIKRAEAQIIKDLKEKEILLKEVHHRVKNNLNIIVSLLNLQSRHIITREQALTVFQESRDRIYAMSLVHEKLYRSMDFSSIDMKDYIHSIAEHHIAALHTETQIGLDIDIKNVYLPINYAIPCGLIINELMTNAMKHAFPQRSQGLIHIQFHRRQTGDFHLRISDDGIGLPEGMNVHRKTSLGLQIVELLAEQLGGHIQLDPGLGTTFVLTFHET